MEETDLSIRIPNHLETSGYETKREERMKLRPDWTISSLIGCCVERLGRMRTSRPCYLCKRIVEWRNLFYSFHDGEEEKEYIRKKMSKWKK